MKLYRFLLIFSLLLFFTARGSATEYLFKNHRDDYKVYRIPAIVGTANGRLLAFCEGRQSLMDHGNIDLVMKTSADNGQTWSKLKVIWNEGSNTCGNPSPIVDRQTGEVIVLATLNNDKVFVLRSKDEGETWEKPEEITASVKPVNWKWYATGPVHAIQLQQTDHKNRIVVPCNHTVSGIDKHISHVIYSDDHGISWQAGGSVSTERTDECTVAELGNGNLLLNMRNSDRTLPNRKISFSSNGGLAWSPAVYDSSLIEPVCQGALLRYSAKPGILLFSNPLHTKLRKRLTISVSYDEGKTWTNWIKINEGKSAYSDIIVLNSGDVLCLYETGKLWPYSGIAAKTIKGELIAKQ